MWDDPQAQALIDESFSRTGPAKRQAIFDKLHPAMLAQAPRFWRPTGTACRVSVNADKVFIILGRKTVYLRASVGH